MCQTSILHRKVEKYFLHAEDLFVRHSGLYGMTTVFFPIDQAGSSCQFRNLVLTKARLYLVSENELISSCGLQSCEWLDFCK